MDGIGVYSEGDNAWYLIASWVQLKGDLENDESSATSLVSLPALTAFAALLAVWNAARHY
jgi:hypothetical protein